MWYLFTQIWLWLVIAFTFGWIAHWLVSRRTPDDQSSSQQTAESADEPQIKRE